ncbi:MAG: fused MFS/spermidine synthase [Bacteroidales bacterium]|nr:fused MFS/spermidine synthase [Bacteroidales bacterium]
MKLTSRIFTPLLLLHIYLTGFAVFIILYILLRQFSLNLGQHMTGIGILTAAFLLAITVGSSFLGKRADKTVHLPALLIILELGIAIYGFSLPLLQFLLIKTTGLVSQYLNAGTLGTSLLRFLVSFVLLLPAAMAGGLIPVYSKFTIRHVSHIGKKTGMIFALLNAGALTACCIGGLYMIPEYGHFRSLIVVSSILILNSLLSLLFLLPGASHPGIHPAGVLAQKARRSGLSVLKKQVVLEAESKLTRTLLWVVSIQGFTATAYIILWARTLLSLSSVSNDRTMIVMLLLTTAGMALGSTFFKGLADRPRRKFFTLGLIEMLIGISAMISYIAMFPVMERYTVDPSDAGNFWSGFRNELLFLSVFMFLPSFFTGATFPMACRLYPKRLKKAGQRIGWLVSIFFLGAIMSLFMISFLFIPLIGMNTTFFIVVTISIIIGIVLILRDSRFKRGFRMTMFLIAVAIIIGLQHFFRQQNHQMHRSELNLQDSIQVIKEGSTASVLLIKRSEGQRDLFVNGTLLFQENRENLKVQQMLAYLPSIFGSRNGSAYLVGFGMGIAASTIEKCGFENIQITEIAPEIVSVASASYADLNDDILTNKAITIEINDSRSFLRQNNTLYDLITFSHTNPDIKPDHYSQEFYRLCYEKLEQEGVFCQIVPVSGMEIKTFRSILESCCSAFPEVTLWYGSPEKMLMLAAKNQQSHNFCELLKRFSQFNREGILSRAGFPSLESFLGRLLLDPLQIREFTALSDAFTDDRPIWKFNKPVITGMNIELLQHLREPDPVFQQFIDFTGDCVPVEAYTMNIIESYRKISMAEIDNAISREGPNAEP